MRSFPPLACLTSIVLVASCGDLKALMTLQQQIAQRFEAPTVSVNLNNNQYLTIIFQNSPLAALPPDERASLAHNVALFVRDHYPGYSRLSTVSVGFATQRKAGMINVRHSEVPYSFSPSDLGQPQPGDSAEAKPPKAAT